MADEETVQFDSLREIIKNGDYFEYRVELENMRNIDYQDKDGMTLLRHAVRKSCMPAVVATLAKGANPNIADLNGLTPLTVAIWKGFLHIAAILLQSGANPDVPDKLGRVPLFFALRRCDVRAVRLLLDFKANPNALCQVRRRDGTVSETEKSSLLAVAVKSGCYEGIKMLRDAGAKLDNGTERPLLLAVQYGKRESLGALLEGQEKEVFATYDGKSFISLVIKSQSTMLPVIAGIAEQQSQKDKSLRFPPSDVKGGDWKKLKEAKDRHDCFLATKFIEEDVAASESIWTPIGPDARKCTGKKVSLRSMRQVQAQTSPKKVYKTALDPLSEGEDEEEENEEKSSEVQHATPPLQPPLPPSVVPEEECDSLGELLTGREKSSRKPEVASDDDEFLPPADANSISLSFDTDVNATGKRLPESSSSVRGQLLPA